MQGGVWKAFNFSAECFELEPSRQGLALPVLGLWDSFDAEMHFPFLEGGDGILSGHRY